MADPTDADFSFLDLPDDQLDNYQPGPVPKAAFPSSTSNSGGEDEATGNDAGAASGSSPAATAAAATPVTPEPTATAQADPDKKDPVTPPAGKPAASPEANPMADGKPVVQPAATEPPASTEVKEAPGSTEAKPAAIDYEAEYKRVLAPFKANGKEIAVDSVDDAIALMQMGANYNKKMAALKPNLTLLKMLENNGLLSEEKISFLIDLSKKDPGAINKLVKDSGLDPMELDADKAAGYKPTVHKVDERELELDAVLDELQTTPTFQRTLSIVTKEWDAPSKQFIADSPQLLKLINEHVSAGIYDLISNRIERERMLGRLTGLNDLQAYKQVGDAIEAQGGFAHLSAKKVEQGQATATPPVIVKPSTSQEEEERIKERKRAAGTPKAALPPTTTPASFNPLALSDEEFAKLARSKYR